MANQTGQGANVPKISRATGTTGEVPQIRYGTTTGMGEGLAQSARTVADVLQRVQMRMEDRLDLQAKIEGAKEGTLAGIDGVPTLQDELTIRGRAFNTAARDAVDTQFELQSRLTLAEYEKTSGGSATAFKAKSDKYLEGVMGQLEGFDPAMAQRFAANYKLKQENVLSSIAQANIAAARDKQVEGALMLHHQLETDLAGQASQLFAAGPENVQKVMAEMISNAAKLQDLAHQLGADGKPLFSARERVSIQLQAETAVSENIGGAWLKSQKDLPAALDMWRKGTAEIEVADDQGNTQRLNLKEILGPAGYVQAEKGFIENLRGELALNAQLDAAADRNFKKSSDALYTDMSVAAQQGALTLPIVEAGKSQLEPERYLALREIARKGGASVSDGKTYSDLAVADAGGEDIRPRLQSEFTAGKLSTDDYLRLFDRNTERLGKGQPDPVSTGRDFVGNSLGKLSTELGFAQSISIPQAEAEYTLRIEQFKTENERLPNAPEALDIGRDVVRRYSVMDTRATIQNMPLPKYMTPGEKFSVDLKFDNIKTVAQKTRAEFLKTHNGDVEAMKKDPKYIEEMKLLSDYANLIKLRDNNAPAK